MTKRHKKHARNYKKKLQGNCPVGIIEINPQGYGFVDTDEGSFFIPANRIGSAMNGDKVEVRPRSQKVADNQKHIASVVRVHERACEYVVGVLKINDPLAAVVPRDPRILHDIFVDLSQCQKASDGDVVLARITQYPNRRMAAQGYIIEVLGTQDAPGMDVDIIIHNAGLATEFSPSAIQSAKELISDKDKLDELDKYDDLGDLGPRQDLTKREIFTIDPHDAKDYDDAISIDHVEGLIRLGVHIADVAHYVAFDESIDICARDRATSVYLVDRVLPMLPEELSCDLCSLKPGVDRLAITCDMYLNESAELQKYKIYPSIIRSNRRFSYEQVQEILDETSNANEPLEPRLKELNELAHKLLKLRQERGALDFDGVEPKPILDERGKVQDVKLRSKNDATSMIEEAMILANETVAFHLQKNNRPCVYRVHEAPRPSNVESMLPIIKAHGFSVKGLATGEPSVYQKLLMSAKNTASHDLIESVVLRNMERAYYSTDALSHFGLASRHYCHFTSPIRRYPDLMVHRLLRDAHAMEGQLDWLAQHSSKMERLAEKAETDSVRLKLCEYVCKFIGQTLEGCISGLQTYGIFVRLGCGAEGYVHFDPVRDEYYKLDFEKQLLVGEETGRKYHFGQFVQVRIEGVDLRTQSIDLRLC